MYSLRANTPEEVKSDIVKWLKMLASNHRINASRAVRVGTRHEETAIASAYQNAAEMLEKCEIVKY